MFNSSEEYIRAMLDGRKFIDNYGYISYYDKTRCSFILATKDINAKQNLRSKFTEFTELTEIFNNWYDDPANIGKLCWFWDNCSETLTLDTFKCYDTDENIPEPFETVENICYAHARLLTEEELALLKSPKHITSL